MQRKVYLLGLVLLLTLTLAACGTSADKQESTEEVQGNEDVKAVEKKLVLADGSWDSIRVHNAIATTILEQGYGFDVEVIPGSTANLEQAHMDGDVNIHMEQWPDNYPTYQPAVDEGKIIEVGVNFDDNAQGFYVPRYVVEGDEERGIEALAPDLKTVEDLKKYPDLFPDQEDPGKGAIVNAPPSWNCAEIMEEKWKYYGLDEMYNLVNSGSDSGLSASLSGAYEKGEPWVGYYWEPTWISGKYDIVLLEEEPFSEEAWEDSFRCAFKSVTCTITMDKASYEKFPEVAEFLSKYKTSSAIISEFLVYMQENDAEIQETADWFLKEKQDIWKPWVTEDVFDAVTESLES